MPIEFEYTARNTPQQNHLAEIGIYVICCQGRALMSRANSPRIYRYWLFWLVTEMACALDWLTVVTVDGVMAMQIKHFADKIPDFVKNLKTFGEACVVTIAGSIKSKVNMRGVVCMMGGYCTDRAGDCYRMYDPIRNNIYETRDVVWLNRMYFDNNGEVDALPDISADAAPAQPLTQVLDKQVVLRPKKKKKKKKKSITFAIPNGEAGSVVSWVTQFRTFGAASEDDIDFEDDNNNNIGNDDNSVTGLTDYGDRAHRWRNSIRQVF
jgi:hypothetical protein